jgi:hypothetical protein
MVSQILWQTKNLSSTHMEGDKERELVSYLCEYVAGAGIASDPIAAVNFYVALKSKPLVVLTGPSGSGKIALVERLSDVLNLGSSERNDSQRFQTLLGHPWWAGKSENMALFTDAHTRFNSERLLHMMSEAWRQENEQRLFIVCLTKISPAELMTYFCDLASQIGKGELIRLGELHLETPLPLPPNLRIVGTMDTIEYRWWDQDLLSQTIIIPWMENGEPTSSPKENSNYAGDCIFLQSSVRERNGIYRKIHSILSGHRQPLDPLFKIENLLLRYGGQSSKSPFEDALGYLANSWSVKGNGLFDRSPTKNLAIAMDLVISHIILPPIIETIKQNEDFRKTLKNGLTRHYPRSASLIKSITTEAGGYKQ